MTDPQTFYQGMLVTLWVFLNLATWSDERTPSAKGDLAPKTSLHRKMKGSDEKLSNDSKKWSISQSQLKDHPLMKQDILQVYSDVFTGIGKFPGMPIQIPN